MLLLAHIGTFVMLALVKKGVLLHGQSAFNTGVTWTVYGFLPLLVCSYLPFHLVARPLEHLLMKDLIFVPPRDVMLVTGGGYGLCVGLGLCLMLNPGTLLGNLLLVGLGVIVGVVNWFLYIKIRLIKE